jgi:hypothetical protein
MPVLVAVQVQDAVALATGRVVHRVLVTVVLIVVPTVVRSVGLVAVLIRAHSVVRRVQLIVVPSVVRSVALTVPVHRFRHSAEMTAGQVAADDRQLLPAVSSDHRLAGFHTRVARLRPRLILK